MIVHPTRTNLLLLKEKVKSVINSIGILKARRQALIREFLKASAPFLRSRDDIKKTYGKAMDELALSLGHEGRNSVESVTRATVREMDIDIIEKSIWGLRYKDIDLHDRPVRDPDERGYDFLSGTPHIEESAYLFEKILESMLELAVFENKLKRLGIEITRITRKIRMLEEKKMPELKCKIKSIAQYIGEREREAYYRLKKIKDAGLRKR